MRRVPIHIRGCPHMLGNFLNVVATCRPRGRMSHQRPNIGFPLAIDVQMAGSGASNHPP